MKQIKRIVLLLVLSLSCFMAPAMHGATNLVRMFNFYFNPTNLTIAPGDTVLWTNTSLTTHDSTSTTGLWGSPNFSRPGTYAFRFTNAGAYPYVCQQHIAGMP